MQKLIFLVLPFVALMGCAHTPAPESCSDREPASLKDAFQKQVMSHVDCGSTTDNAAPGLRTSFEQGRDAVIATCVNNPVTPALFTDDDSKSSVAARVQAYCQLNPVLRFCMICNRMKDSPPLDESFRRCQNYADVGAGETEQKFQADVMTKRPPSQ